MIVFVGEKPSRTAFEKGWTWESKRLASATLHEALAACGINQGFAFINLFGDHPDDPERIDSDPARDKLMTIASWAPHRDIIALGLKVSRGLSAAGIEHRMIRHPAARGAGRAKHIYHAHVADVLLA